MTSRILFFFLSLATISHAQWSTKPDSTLAIDDYWEQELGPITDLNEIVNYIHNDPFNFMFVSNIPGGNPLAREISVNSFYGARKHPIHQVLKFHRGIDLQGVNGEQVIASGNGKVIDTGFREDLGNFIKIKHKYGFESIYGHLSKISVKKGELVIKGQKIGKVGSTGKVTGPHLHYTLKKNETYLDPFDFLFMTFEKAF
jgi:murein DD-endopeptidase MepM/ murein hydrolase activator NlpD